MLLKKIYKYDNRTYFENAWIDREIERERKKA
jgi:hypothetical protein